ncbi:MAG: AAA family ATPase [Magnetococcales bacterium]|nr:AAA family ATPase [Magnetococcales bacterium]
MAFKIEKALRKQIPGLFMFWGPSASGKTYSALRFARGLVGDAGKICVIDTENRRSLFYAGTVGGNWDFVDFQPDFTTQRYIEIIRQAEQAGYDAILIDSFSHVWQGEGGVLDEADKSDSKGLAKWAKPKMALKRLVNVALRAKCHVIFCLRSKMGVVQTGTGRDLKILSSGLAPIMEKGLIYEMMISILFGPDHKPMFQNISDRFFVDPHIPAVKAPAGLIELIKPGEYVTEATGDAVRQWLDGGQRDVIDDARRVASRGSIVFREQWKLWSQTDRDQLRPFTKEFQDIAAKADEEIAKESDPQTWEEQIPEEGDSESWPGTNDALSSGFNSIPAQEPEQSPASAQPQTTELAPESQSQATIPIPQSPVAQPPVVQSPVLSPTTQASAQQPSAPQAAKPVQRQTAPKPATSAQSPAVSPPPRRAAVPATNPGGQHTDMNGTNPF